MCRTIVFPQIVAPEVKGLNGRHFPLRTEMTFKPGRRHNSGGIARHTSRHADPRDFSRERTFLARAHYRGKGKGSRYINPSVPLEIPRDLFALSASATKDEYAPEAIIQKCEATPSAVRA